MVKSMIDRIFFELRMVLIQSEKFNVTKPDIETLTKHIFQKYKSIYNRHLIFINVKQTLTEC